MDYLSLLKFFAKPLGGLINNALIAGAGSIIGYSAAHGNPFGDVTPLVSAAVVVISTAITGFASTQGIKIPIINEDKTNGLKVVKSDGPGEQVDASPLKAAR
jgi:hypothetical protein